MCILLILQALTHYVDKGHSCQPLSLEYVNMSKYDMKMSKYSSIKRRSIWQTDKILSLLSFNVAQDVIYSKMLSNKTKKTSLNVNKPALTYQ